MGARPLRRAIQRYIEDPLADEVLRQGDIVPGTTVLVERDPTGDDDERPLKLKLVKPKKRQAKKREPVGVAAKSGDDDGSASGSGDPMPEPTDQASGPSEGPAPDEPAAGPEPQQE
jgi:ATP-dependent Clp protease ATP-binding subunit ClpC